MLNIIIVSHNHEDYVKNLLGYLNAAEASKLPVRIVIKDNKNSNPLREICEFYSVIYCSSETMLGFGANNNFAVKYIIDSYGISDDDYFLFLNPDILFSIEQLNCLIKTIDEQKVDACTIDLFKDNEYKQRDLFIRRFPTAKDFFSSYVLGKNETVIDRSKVTQPMNVDWCAGSFMVFKADVFLSLKGFDESYFMYCEDLDICYRLKLAGFKLTYFPALHAVHYAQHANRKLLSKPFYWHLKSALRYLIKTNLYKNPLGYNSKTTSLLKYHE